MIVTVGWVLMGMAATGISTWGAYRFLTMPCEGAWCGGGTFFLASIAFMAGMICMGLAEGAGRRQAQVGLLRRWKELGPVLPGYIEEEQEEDAEER